MRFNLFDLVAARSRQTAEFINGDYAGGSAELFVSALPAALATSLVCRLSALTFAEVVPATRRPPTSSTHDSTSTSFPLSLQSTGGGNDSSL